MQDIVRVSSTIIIIKRFCFVCGGLLCSKIGKKSAILNMWLVLHDLTEKVHFFAKRAQAFHYSKIGRIENWAEIFEIKF